VKIIVRNDSGRKSLREKLEVIWRNIDGSFIVVFGPGE
jgi:hypothetical protein